MVVTIILILLAGLMACSIESNLREAFSGDWMRFDEPKTDMDNSEFDWGHNVKHRTEEDYEEFVYRMLPLPERQVRGTERELLSDFKG